MKAQICWMPVDSDGKIWYGWARPTKKELLDELNEEYYGSWEADNIRLARVEIHETKRARRVVGKGGK